MQLTNDSYALIMACSYVGLDAKGDLIPLTQKEWNSLVQKIVASGLESPGDLPGLSAGELQQQLDLPTQEAERLARLLDRGGAVGVELESLASSGISVLTRADAAYPPRLKEKLKAQAPPVLFLAGDLRLAENPGVAIVGSRSVDTAGEAFTILLATQCARNKLNVVSGGAKGVDIISMKTVLEHGGTCIGVLSDSLARKIREQETRTFIFEERLLLISPFHPRSPFQVANAMSRNKLIYALADFAIVVASDFKKGGTWAGATENLRKGYTPLLVRADSGAPEGNSALLEKGAVPLRQEELEAEMPDLLALLAGKIQSAGKGGTQSQQLGLF